MEIHRCYDLFLTDRKISGCSESTLRFYEYVIGKFLRYIKENNFDLSVESTHQHILPFFSHLQQQNLSSSTYHSLFRGIRAFTRFLYEEKYVSSEIRLPKVKWTPLSRPILGKNKTSFKLPQGGLLLAFGRPTIGVVFGGYNSRNRCPAPGSSRVRSRTI